LALVVALVLGVAGLVVAGFVALYPGTALHVVAGVSPRGLGLPSWRGHGGERSGPEPPAAAAIALDAPDALGLHFRRPPRAGLVFDVDTGRVLWQRHAQTHLPIASLTKIMTALVVVDRTTSREHAKITRAALNYAGRGVGLPKGRRAPVEGLLHGMLLVSGNDAAKVLAIHVGGSERRFVRMMNARARGLRLRCTHFTSPHGLEPGNRSCAADVASMARLAMRERRIKRIVRKPDAAVHFPVKGGRLFVYSTNPLLRPKRWPGTVGLKTGFTDPAGRCYVGIVRRNGHRLGVVLLHSPDPADQAKKLLGTAFRRLSRHRAHS
jgi:D-alanyl-D-alanine carboxypeptidase